MTRLVLACVLVLLTGAQASAQLVELEGRYWRPELDGSVRIQSGSIPPTTIDLEDDLGLDRDDAPDVRLTIATGLNSRIRLGYTRLLFDADTTLERTIQFAGTTFTVASRVESELDIHYGRLGWVWQPLAVPGILRVGPLLEVKGFIIDASLRTRGVSPEIKESATLPLVLPTLGVALDLTPHRMVHVFAEASGLPAGSLGHFVDAEVGVKFVPFRNLTLSASYRIFDVRVEHDSDLAKIRMSGPAVGLSVRFP